MVKRTVAFISGSRSRGDQSRSLHSRQGTHSRQQLLMKCQSLFPALSYCSSGRPYLIVSTFCVMQPRSDVFKLNETSEKQSGSDQQDHRKSNFSGQEQLPQRRRVKRFHRSERDESCNAESSPFPVEEIAGISPDNKRCKHHDGN